jgi:hypothetical protein
MQVLSGRATMLVRKTSSARRRPLNLVIRRFIDDNGRTNLPRSEPVKPRFNIPGGQEQTTSFSGSHTWQSGRFKSIGDFQFTRLDTHAILIKKSENPPSF